jgi:hypothetical protein
MKITRKIRIIAATLALVLAMSVFTILTTANTVVIEIRNAFDGTSSIEIPLTAAAMLPEKITPGLPRPETRGRTFIFAGVFTHEWGGGSRIFNPNGDRVWHEPWNPLSGISEFHAHWIDQDFAAQLNHGNGDFEIIRLREPTTFLPMRVSLPLVPHLHKFAGYFETADPSQPGQMFYNPYGNVVDEHLQVHPATELHAHFVPTPQIFSVAFDKRGGTGGTDGGTHVIDFETAYYNNNGEFQTMWDFIMFDDLFDGIEPPTRTGFVFMGYYTDTTRIFDRNGNREQLNSQQNHAVLNPTFEIPDVFAVWFCAFCSQNEADCACVRCNDCGVLASACICPPETTATEPTNTVTEPTIATEHTTTERTTRTTEPTTVPTTEPTAERTTTERTTRTTEPTSDTEPTTESTTTATTRATTTARTTTAPPEPTTEPTTTVTEPITTTEPTTEKTTTITTETTTTELTTTEPSTTVTEPTTTTELTNTEVTTIEATTTEVTTSEPTTTEVTTTEPTTTTATEIATTDSVAEPKTEPTTEPTTTATSPTTPLIRDGHHAVAFNPDNGEAVQIKGVENGDMVGRLPSVTQHGYRFLGWFEKLDFKHGDINGDGTVGIGDALQILRFLVGLPNLITENGEGSNAWNAARITGGERPNIGDALAILRSLVGLPSEIDYANPRLDTTNLITADMNFVARWEALPPDVPANFRAMTTGTAVNLSWNIVEFADGYEVMRSNTRVGEYTLIATIDSGSVTTFRDTAAGRRFYTVRAFRNTDNGRLYSDWSGVVET